MKRHRLLDQKQAAELLRKSPGTLKNWRSNKRYQIPYLRIGRSIRYREEDVLAFMEAGLVSLPAVVQ